MDSQQTQQEMEKILRAKFAPTQLEIIDDSHMHAGHGAKGAHFRLFMVSPQFVGKKPLERQRLVYEALAELMRENIHALSMKLPDPR